MEWNMEVGDESFLDWPHGSSEDDCDEQSHLLLPSTEDCASPSSSPFARDLAAELCQYLESEIQGVEGAEDGVEYSIRGITVVHRHGERSPLAEGGTADCTPFRDEDTKEFEKYRETIDSDDFRSFLHFDEEFKDKGSSTKWNLYPEKSICSAGNLGAEGALQLSKLGKHLKTKYESSSLFATGKKIEVHPIATDFRRTLQSAVGLISTFLFPIRQEKHIAMVTIHHATKKLTTGCVDDWCNCEKGFDWRAVYEKEHLEYFKTRTDLSLREKAQRIFKGISVTKKSDDPFSMMDVILGKYMCRRLPLPCTTDGECVSYEIIDELLKETTARGEKMFKDSHYIASKLITLEGSVAPGYVYRMAENLTNYPDTNMIRFISAHDTTVGPILRALRIPFTDFPRYASYIVFELLEDRKKKLFVRIVYNGKEKTLSSCSGQRLCPIELFKTFVQTTMFEDIGYGNFSDLCESSSNYAQYNNHA